ncbi:hypothetical protein P7K49_039571, partial [Saguinus oedipus]
MSPRGAACSPATLSCLLGSQGSTYICSHHPRTLFLPTRKVDPTPLTSTSPTWGRPPSGNKAKAHTSGMQTLAH